MSNPSNPEWLDAIARLKGRMEQAELRHLMMMEELRKDLASLEQWISSEAKAPEVEDPAVEPPSATVIENEPQLPYLQKAKAEAQPPPLPDPPKRNPRLDIQQLTEFPAAFNLN